MIISLVRNLNLRCYLSSLSTLKTRMLTSRINVTFLLSRYLLTSKHSTVDMACLCSMVYVASAEDTQNDWEWLEWQVTESWRGFLPVWWLIWDNSKAGLSCGYQLKLLCAMIWAGFPHSMVVGLLDDSGFHEQVFQQARWQFHALSSCSLRSHVHHEFTQIQGMGHRLFMGEVPKT